MNDAGRCGKVRHRVIATMAGPTNDPSSYAIGALVAARPRTQAHFRGRWTAVDPSDICRTRLRKPGSTESATLTSPFGRQSSAADGLRQDSSPRAAGRNDGFVQIAPETPIRTINPSTYRDCIVRPVKTTLNLPKPENP